MEGAVDRLYNSGRFPRALAYLTEEVGIRPFDLFRDFGATVPPHGPSLDRYTDAFYSFAVTLPGVDPERLRDLLVADRLSSVNDHTLPPSLYRRDPLLAKKKSAVRAARIAEGRTAPFAAAILYTDRELLVVEYTDRHPITGQFPSYRLPL
jgi:hypothetical protein